MRTGYEDQRTGGRALSPGETRAPSTSGKPANSTAVMSFQPFSGWWAGADTHHGDRHAEDKQQGYGKHVDAVLFFEALVPGKKHL